MNMDGLDGITPAELEVGSYHKIIGCIDFSIKDIGRNRISPGKCLSFVISILAL